MALWFTSCGAGGSSALISASTAGIFVTPTTVLFGDVSVGTATAAKTITLTSSGSGTLTISSITASGDFAQTNNCGTSVAAGENCTVSVVFTPTATGTRSGTLSISDNSSGSPDTVTLTGTGVAVAPPATPGATVDDPVVSLSPSSLSFASRAVGTNANQVITLTNTGNASLLLTSISVTGANAGDFNQSNNCRTWVAPGGGCTFEITFTPSATGTRTASLTLVDNADDSPQSVSLTGTGTSTAPVASLSPTSLTFSSQAVGSSSAAQAVTLTNSGNAALSVTTLTFKGTNVGDFAQTNTCGSSVVAGGNCTISVTFAPAASGSRTATLSITDNASGSPQTVSLTGTGTAPVATVSPTSLTFAGQAFDTTSSAQTVTLTNSGNAALSVTSLTFTGTNASDFTQTDTCGSSVAAGAKCTIAILFTPAASGARTAALRIADNATGSPQTVSLSGTGSHDVVLSWTASATAGVTGYDIYRGTTSGGKAPRP